MATIQQQAIHWRDRAIARSEAISDAWQVALAYAGRFAEIVLFLCMVVSLIQMVPTIHLDAWLTGAVLIIQMVTLDIAGFGLNSLAKQVRRAGDEVTAKKAEDTGNFLIVIMIVSLLSVAIKQMFGASAPLVGIIMVYVDYALILTRVVMTVLYGRVIHALRESQQHMQAQADTTLVDLRADLAKEQNEQKKLEKALANEQESTKKQRAENEQLAQKLADIQESLRDTHQKGTSIQASMAEVVTEKKEKDSQIQRLSADLQSAKATIFRLQNVEGEAARLQMDRQKLSTNLETANLQIADLATKLERAKNKIVDLQHADKPSAKQTAKDNITSIEQARTKGKMNHAEVIAFMASHTDLKRAEVAAQLGISERKVYDAVAWQREQEQENAVALQ